MAVADYLNQKKNKSQGDSKMKNLTEQKNLVTVRSAIIEKKNYFLNLSYVFKSVTGELSKIRTVKEKSFIVSTSEKQAREIKKAVQNGLFNVISAEKTSAGFSGLIEVFTSKKNIFEYDLIISKGMYKINVEHTKQKAKSKDKASFDARSVR